VNEGQGVILADLDSECLFCCCLYYILVYYLCIIIVFLLIEFLSMSKPNTLLQSNLINSIPTKIIIYTDDGDPDIASASSGDNTIAVFKNIQNGIFCEIKEVVDNNAIGARTVVAADLNGDGWLDLASASKDDDSVAWYPNDGTGHFPTKIVISSGEESTGAYSLVAVDIDQDGDQDLVVASNGNDHVSIWRNMDGKGNFEKTLVYDEADFVLSVTAFDFDRDGDIDIASASFFDGRIIWYENIDGEGYEWKNHTIYDENPNAGGHYVSHGDMDGDGDYDLIAVTNAENTVAVYWAATECDDRNSTGAECCATGSQWNGTACEFCKVGSYGVGIGVDAKCVACPTPEDDQCTIPGLNVLPPTCGLVTGCVDVKASIAACSCPTNEVRDPMTDSCEPCPAGQIRPDTEEPRDVSTLGNYTVWQDYQGTCEVIPREEQEPLPLNIIIPVVVIVSLLIFGLFFIVYRQRKVIKYNTRDLKHAPRDGTIVFVFTDIEGSTALWDTSKATMTKALDVHHNVIRKVIERHNGYEVKTIGDSFMVALGSADAAVQLANDIQKDLLDAEWPTELANLPGGCSEFVNIRGEKNKRVFNGLRVRIGIHLGEHSDLEEGGGMVQTKYDEVAKGYDYYGPAVNAASRIEALAFGGQTLLSSEVFTQLSDKVKDECRLHVVGGLKLKGIEDEVFLHQCLPLNLKGRTFRGVFRRRDSEGGSIGGPDDLEAMVTRGASILIGSSFLESEDLTGDVMAMTPIQLQSVVTRLRNKISALESATNNEGMGRRASELSSSSGGGDYPSENGDGHASPSREEVQDFIDEVKGEMNGDMPVVEAPQQPQIKDIS
jgi:class 3 adenylate cyclase